MVERYFVMNFKHKKVVMLIAAILMMAMVFCGCSSGKKNEEEVVKEEVKPTYTNPLTGEVSEEEWPARPLIVSIDNVGDAIPQSNLSYADMVYEFPVEGGQTRLQAIFYSEFPECFGPIRSTRPYFVDLTREYKGIFLAHGWSPDAKTYLLSDVVPYINAMNSSCKFYRVSDKAAPHNSYIEWAEVKAKIDEQGWWDEQQDIRAFKFLKEGKKNEGESAEYISFRYNSAACEFTYDAETNKYTRTTYGNAYIDKETGESITVSNVLVQKVTSSVLDSKGRLSIDMCAGGEAILFTNGVAVKGTWSRESLDSRTIFVDEEGNEFKLTSGKTWVEVTDQNCYMEYEGAETETEESEDGE